MEVMAAMEVGRAKLGAFLKDGAPCLTATILTQLSKLAASTAGMLRR